MLHHFESNRLYHPSSVTDAQLSTEMSLFGNDGIKHIIPEITILDEFAGVKGAATEADTHIMETLRAYIQVDKDGNLVHVCDGHPYHRFFQAYKVGSGTLEYKLDVKDVSIRIISWQILLTNTPRTSEYI